MAKFENFKNQPKFKKTNQFKLICVFLITNIITDIKQPKAFYGNSIDLIKISAFVIFFFNSATTDWTISLITGTSPCKRNPKFSPYI